MKSVSLRDRSTTGGETQLRQSGYLQAHATNIRQRFERD